MSATVGPLHDELQLPSSMWWFAWSFVVGQVLELGRRGAQSEDNWVLSALLGAVLITFISHGVLRARWVRLSLVVLLIGLSAILELVSLVAEPSGWTASALALSLVQAVLLYRYIQSDWFEHQRQRLPGGPSLTPILAVAALVGVLGGVLGAEQAVAGAGTDVSYEDPSMDPFMDSW